jgi:hypothetical protein
MKFSQSAFIYWFSIAGFGGGALLCLYYFLRRIGMGLAFLPLPSPSDDTGTLENRRKAGAFLSRELLSGRRTQIRECAQILLLVVASRLLIILLANMALMMLKNDNGHWAESLSWMWSKWDSGHFLQVARHGYLNEGEERFFIVFLPLYPFFIRCGAFFFHSFEWTGVIISNLSLWIAGCYLYFLIRLDYNRRIASYAVLLLLFFPFSFFWGIVYSDSLFLALSIMTFYYLRKVNWAAAACCGFLAALTRNFGVLLAAPALLELFWATDPAAKLKKRDYSGLKEFGRQVWYPLAIPLGFGIYLLSNKMVTGDWFKFAIYQSQHWGNRFGFFAANLANYFSYAINGKACERIAMWIPQMILLGLGLGLFFYGFYRQIRLPYLLYMLLYLFTCASATWLISGARYVTGLFPIYLLLALLVRQQRWRIVAFAFSVALLSFYVVAFVTDFYVM